MKKLLFVFGTLLLALTGVHGQNACQIVITGSFDSECMYDFKTLPVYETPDIMVACQNSTVTYTAYADVGTATVSGYIWEVYGDVSHTASGNQVTVNWSNASWGMVVVTVTTTTGDTCTKSSYVGLIESPTVAAATVPAYTINSNGDKVIRVCDLGRVEFVDQSSANGSDLAGFFWESKQGGTSTTPNYVLEGVTADDLVVHRVYNNCGCYDEEIYYIEVLKGNPLELECYGTVCDGALVEYTVISPVCHDYIWHVEGGTLVHGQYSGRPVVQWDRPQGGYGVLSLDGVQCGDQICPAMMSVRVPVIQDSLAIEGSQSVCLGESVLYRLPLFGSTEYTWDISPSVPEQGLYEHGNEMRYTFTDTGTYHITVSYRCDFLDCGPYHTRDLTVTVRPQLDIVGNDRICTSNYCSLSTSPLESVTWQAYSLSTNQPVGNAVTGLTYSERFTSGRYLITASHPNYCGPATFVLNVLAPPPAPTVTEMDPNNRHTACRDGGIGLAGTPSQPNYLLVWAPACSTATPQLYTGDSVNISYGATVCDVEVYHYDVLMQCQSATPYVHTVSALAPEPTTLPSRVIVCPNSLVSFTGMVPDQRADGMLYEWKPENFKQNRCSVTGSHQGPDVNWIVNRTGTLPDSFYVILTRSWCNSMSVNDSVKIVVRNDLSSDNLVITGPDQLCEGSSAEYTFSGCDGSPTAHATCTFSESGTRYVTFYCNPYDYCDNRDYYSSESKAVTVLPKPVATIVYDDATGSLTVNATGSGPFTYVWSFQDITQSPHWVYVGNTVTVQVSNPGLYRCNVTDGNGCSTQVTYYHDPPLMPYNPMTLGYGSYDYCGHSIQVTSPYSTRNVSWTVTGGDYEIVTSGTHNSVATVTVADVGPYTVCAQTRAPVPGMPIEVYYEGCYTFTADFVRDFEFETKCDTIVILNHSKYLLGSSLVYMEVRDGANTVVGSFSFPVSQELNTFATPQNGTYTFYLTQYGNEVITPPCSVGSVTINLPANPSVSITTENTYDPNATCNQTPIQLTATLGYSGASIVSSSWNFGDGSSYKMDGNSVYHTFRAFDNYSVSVNVTDSRGCKVSSYTPLNILSYFDNLLSGNLYQGNISCPNMPLSGVNVYFSPDAPPPYNHYTWTTPSTGTGNAVWVNKPMDCLVSVVNDNFCHKQATRRALFLPCPTARIHADSYSCCEDDSLLLRGSLAPNQYISYMWNVICTNPPYNATFNTPDIVFIPPAAGSYSVELTVTDGIYGCSSTTHTTVQAVPKPAAPALYFPGDSCISGAPVTLSATAASYSGELHWSNGETGATADYYTPGNATAYYYDPAIGCASQVGAIRIHHQPDFDALLTGCYEKCQDFLSGYQLPVYCLTPDRIDWQWFLGNSLLASDYHAGMSLSLPLVRPDTYRLEVDYQNSGCHTTSPNLSITGKKECDCDSIRVEVLSVTPHVVDCIVQYDVTMTVCNDNANEDFCIDDVLVISDANNVTVKNVTYSSATVHANSCETVNLTLKATGLIPTSVLLQLTDKACMGCTKAFNLHLPMDTGCVEDLMDGYVNPNFNLCDEAAAYFDFEVWLNDGCELLGVWSEPAMILNYVWSPSTGILSGIYMLDMAELGRLAYEKKEVCLHALLCCNDVVCDNYLCMDAQDLLDMLDRSGGGGEHSAYRPRFKPVEVQDLRLMPNPTTGEVSVIGTPDEVTEVLVMDMHGRRMAMFEKSSRFDIGDLPSGSYIVRVKTRQNEKTAEKTSYLKLVKK